MSSDFDFGEFLDSSNQSELMTLCLELFGLLAAKNIDEDRLENAKVAVLNHQLTKNFEGFRSAISHLSDKDKKSHVNSMKHINLMTDTLVGDSKSKKRFSEIEKKINESVDELINGMNSENDMAKLVQVYNFLPSKKELAIILSRITDYGVKATEKMDFIKTTLMEDDVEVRLTQVLAELSEKSSSGFISANNADILQERGVEFHIAGLVTKEALENISDEQLKNNILLMLNFNEDIFTTNPEFLDTIQTDAYVLTSTSGMDSNTFDMLLLLKNERKVDIFEKFPVKVKEYKVCK
tara:strand:- start:227 stop:1111 length:885 start_codon:yes stop_codon:yes gene_type:complete